MKRIIASIVSASALVSASVLADGAANAYVSIDAPGARNQGGVDFAVKDSGDAVSVAVKAQPGWELTSSPVVVIPKGSAGTWSAKSFYGESGSGGEICVPTSSISTNHIHGPKVKISLQVSHGNGSAKSAEGEVAANDKERGGIINIAAVITGVEPGLHRVLKVHDTCPGGKSNVHTEEANDIPIPLDNFKWSWSVGGQFGTSTDSALLVPGVKLSKGKYTVSVTLTATSSKCGSCNASASATREINIGNGVIK